MQPLWQHTGGQVTPDQVIAGAIHRVREAPSPRYLSLSQAKRQAVKHAVHGGRGGPRGCLGLAFIQGRFAKMGLESRDRQGKCSLRLWRLGGSIKLREHPLPLHSATEDLRDKRYSSGPLCRAQVAGVEARPPELSKFVEGESTLPLQPCRCPCLSLYCPVSAALLTHRIPAAH